MVLLLLFVVAPTILPASSELDYEWIEGDETIPDGESSKLRVQVENNAKKERTFSVKLKPESKEHLYITYQGKRVQKISLGKALPTEETRAKTVKVHGATDVSKTELDLDLVLFDESKKLSKKTIEVEVFE